jgi:hypothetical protein
MSKQGKKPIPTVVCLPPRCSGSAVMESWIGRRRLGVCDFIYVERDGYCFSFFVQFEDFYLAFGKVHVAGMGTDAAPRWICWDGCVCVCDVMAGWVPLV